MYVLTTFLVYPPFWCYIFVAFRPFSKLTVQPSRKTTPQKLLTTSISIALCVVGIVWYMYFTFVHQLCVHTVDVVHAFHCKKAMDFPLLSITSEFKIDR